VLAAHCVHVDEGEIRTLLHARAGVAHNPSSNLKLASGFAPVRAMLEAGLDVGIGTDGTASNNDLDMFEEMRLASFIAKAVAHDPTALPAKQVLAMATRIGARALHMGDEIGSIEPGKRADLALVDLSALHTRPHFDRETDSVYGRLVYSAKSSDVWGVLVNGQWLMRDRRLLTIDIDSILEAAEERARHIDVFLIEREESILSKLVAIGGAAQEESYEVQIKVRLSSAAPVLSALEEGPIEVLRHSHYQEYDTYFSFEHPIQDRLRYREDEFVGEDGKVFNVRYRLTMMGPAAEREFPNSALLSRARFIAPATHSLRFYREYFKPVTEKAINKDRLRWKVRFRGVEFFINLDRLTKPQTEGWFLEVKSRTWSRHDAEEKAALISDLLSALGVGVGAPAALDYLDLVPPEASPR
jgi:5-methylthioadenosine/S-adenosylhomocysteine deaminase